MKKILLIDDEKDFCAVVKKRLELISDYRVIPAYSAKEGLHAAVLTAKEDDETKLNAAGLYDDDYIVKPVEMDILKSKIDNVLARKKPAPQ